MITKFDSIVLAGMTQNPASVVVVKSAKLDVTQEELDRDVVKPSMGKLPHVMGKKSLKLELVVEMRCPKTDGTAPDFGPLLKMCGLSETLSVDAATYKPQALPLSAGFIRIYKDGLRWDLLNAQGNMTFDASAGQIGTMTFSMQSLYTEPVEEACPLTPLPDMRLPVFANVTDSVIQKAGGVNESLKIGAFTFDAGNEIAEHYRVGGHNFSISGRNPSLKFVRDSVATVKEWDGLVNGEQLELSAKWGVGTGAIVQFSCKNGRRGSVAYGERNEMITLDVAYKIYENDLSVMNDQFTLSFGKE